MIDKKDLKRNYDKYGYILCKDLLPQDVIIELKLLTDQLVRGARSSNASNNIYEFIEEIKGIPKEIYPVQPRKS